MLMCNRQICCLLGLIKHSGFSTENNYKKIQTLADIRACVCMRACVRACVRVCICVRRGFKYNNINNGTRLTISIMPVAPSILRILLCASTVAILSASLNLYGPHVAAARLTRAEEMASSNDDSTMYAGESFTN